MCKKYFNAYKKLLKNSNVIEREQENVADVIDTMGFEEAKVCQHLSLSSCLRLAAFPLHLDITIKTNHSSSEVEVAVN